MQGVATIDYYLDTNTVDVAVSDVVDRDGQPIIEDFGFVGVSLSADGTFSHVDRSNLLHGAFLGPANEEAAGVFEHHNPTVLGSFGARAVPDTVTLEETGTVDSPFTVSDDSGNRVPYFAYYDWGFWGRQFQEDLFGAFVEQTITRERRQSPATAPSEPLGFPEHRPEAILCREAPCGPGTYERSTIVVEVSLP